MSRYRHGAARTPEYRAWCALRSRCDCPNATGYDKYGGRGISYDPAWAVYECFFADMGNKPSPAHSLDRIDVDGDYCKQNCRWATRKEQSMNRRFCKLTVNGVTKTMAEWAESCGLDRSAIYHRIKMGWDLERAVYTPKGQGGPKRRP